VTDDHPWGAYYKDPLPSGWSYPAGRDLIERALRDANAYVESLSLGRPDDLRSWTG
jgi:hypothetical protein